ncbi:MAG TPA: (2Fe-2S)-binding protein [Halanaerobiales bacterium]|nr:(2Fe-2S)-binding protein [Halanaerobiales bacterium]
MKTINLTVNGRNFELEVKENEILLDTLRKRLNFTGAKEGCGEGECGACTIIMDGEAVTSCLILAVEADGSELETIEGQSIGEEISDIQEAFIEENAIQCGFCTPGMVMSTKALLDRNPNPSDEEIDIALSGNICRCTGYYSIRDAVKRAAEKKGGNK